MIERQRCEGVVAESEGVALNQGTPFTKKTTEVHATPFASIRIPIGKDYVFCHPDKATVCEI